MQKQYWVIGGEYRDNRLADIAHLIARQNGLAVGRQALDARQSEIDGRDIAHIGGRPHRRDTRECQGDTSVDSADTAMSVRRADYAHMQHVREGHIRGETAAAHQQRPILQPRH